MSAALLDALAPQARAEHAVDAEVLVAPTMRRIRNRWLRLAGAWAAGIGLAVWLAVGADPDTAASGEGPGSQASEQTAGTLAAAATPRTSGEAGEGQAAVLCAGGAGPGSACTNVWAGAQPLVVLNSSLTSSTVTAWEDGARITVRWVLANVTDEPLTLDRAGAVIATAASPEVRRDDAGAALWLTDTTRGSSISTRETLAPGDLLAGEAVFDTETASLEHDPVWQIATGRADGVLTVQARISADSPRPGQRVILEAAAPLTPVPLLTGESLSETFTPRAASFGAPTWASAQAALLCDIPEDLQAGTASYTVGFATVEQPCTAGWIPEPVLVAAGPLTFEGRGAGVKAVWGVRNVTGSRLDYTRAVLVLEGDASAPPQSVAGMSLMGAVVVTPGTAWLEDGSRATWLDNARAPGRVEAGEQVSHVDRLFPVIRWADGPVDLPQVIGSLDGRGRATAVAIIPFVTDSTRVLVLEVPLTASLP